MKSNQSSDILGTRNRRFMDIFQIILGSGGLLGFGILIFKMGKFTQKVESMSSELSGRMDNISSDLNKKIDSLASDLKDVKADLKDVKRSVGMMEIQLAKLETRVEERTLRVIHVEHEDREAIH